MLVFNWKNEKMKEDAKTGITGLFVRFFKNIAPVWQNFKIKHPFETSCVHSCVEKKVN